MTEQFTAQTKQLHEVKQTIESLNKEKQTLLQQIDEEKQKYTQLEGEFHKESNLHKQSKQALTNQVTELNAKLYSIEKSLIEAENRYIQAEQKAELACQEAKRLAVEMATAKTLSQLKNSSVYINEPINDDTAVNPCIPQNRNVYLSGEQTEEDKSFMPRNGSFNPSFRLFPENKKLSASLINGHKVVNSKRHSVSFAPSPIIENLENIRRPSDISTDPG
ncbi:unnamed protein product [Trichobilharzia regenti]|nr:unnamed protein product [Trichobilharzia regenti]